MNNLQQVKDLKKYYDGNLEAMIWNIKCGRIDCARNNLRECHKLYNKVKELKSKIEVETNGWAGEISKIERKKRYSLSICEKEMCKWTLSFGWKDEHSFSRHNFHAEKIVEYNKKIKYLKDCQEAIKICEDILG